MSDLLTFSERPPAAMEHVSLSEGGRIALQALLSAESPVADDFIQFGRDITNEYIDGFDGQGPTLSSFDVLNANFHQEADLIFQHAKGTDLTDNVISPQHAYTLGSANCEAEFFQNLRQGGIAA